MFDITEYVSKMCLVEQMRRKINAYVCDNEIICVDIDLIRNAQLLKYSQNDQSEKLKYLQYSTTLMLIKHYSSAFSARIMFY